MDLTQEQWAIIEPLIPARERKPPGKQGGRPWRPPRDVLNGVLWILRTGAPWADLPARYPPYQTCHRRYQRWVQKGLLRKILRVLAEDLRKRGKMDLTEAFIDGSHAGAKRGELWLDELAGAERPRSWQFQTALAFLSPLGLEVVSDMKRVSSEPSSSNASPESALDV